VEGSKSEIAPVSQVDVTPQELIARIRAEYGITPDGSPRPKGRVEAGYHRAIKALAEDLNSKDIHFILELIQNAEDNLYADGVKPDLTFHLSRTDPTRSRRAGALVLINNEIGLRPEDVDALCDIGKTTKQKQQGYIGEKGIGFKSVFRVTAEPHIFSRGYRFQFQEKPDPQIGVGYIIPYWVAGLPAELEHHRNQTCIVLPLRRGKWNQIARQLRSIAPETILFLSKLQALAIEIDGREGVQVLRDDSRRPLVQFLCGERYAEFWVAQQELAVPSHLDEPKREKVTTRSVSVAFPLDLSTRHHSRTVFAFLPTEVSSGFPFLINADFLLSASREQILVDRPWNTWLRDSIAPVFLEAFETLLAQQTNRAKAYSFIPLASSAKDDFFLPVVDDIHRRLADRDVVWVEAEQDMLVKPAQARLCSEDFWRLLSSQALPAQLRDTPLVHGAIRSYHEQLKAIGVRYLTTEEMLNCLRDSAWLATHDTKWFASLYGFLQKQRWATTEALRDLKLLRLEGGELISAANQPIYFRQESKDILARYRRAGGKVKVQFLDRELSRQVQKSAALMDWLSTTLGVHKLTEERYCLDLARMLSEHREDVAVPDLVKATAHLRDLWPKLSEGAQLEIRDCLPFAMVGGQNDQPDERQWVMPEAMDPKTGWQWVFPGPEDREHMMILSGAYLHRCTKAERGAWQEFFRAFGFTDAPLPRETTLQWWNLEELPDPIVRQGIEASRAAWRPTRYANELKDWRIPHWLDSLCSEGVTDKFTTHRCRALIRWVERLVGQTSTAEPEVLYATHRHFYYRWHCMQIPCRFGRCLLHGAWFPTTKGLKQPGETFLDRQELRELFGRALPYASVNPSPEAARLLGLRQAATVDQMLGYIQTLASSRARHADRHLVTKVYAFLSERWRPDLKARFAAEPLILVLRPKPHWVKSDEAIWPNRRSVFGEVYAYLESEYDGQLRSFFVEQLGVCEQLNPELYAQAWQRLAKARSPDPEATEHALERIFPELLKVAKTAPQPAWWPEFTTSTKVWTQSKRFAPARHVFIPDDGDLRRLFRDEVEYAWQPKHSSFAEFDPLYHALGVRSLAESVKAVPKVDRPTTMGEDSILLTRGAKRAIAYYLWNVLPEVYRRAKDKDMLGHLLKAREKPVARLLISFTLGRVTVHADDGGIYWDQGTDIIYRSNGVASERLEIAMATHLAQRLTSGSGVSQLDNLIGRVLGASENKSDGIIDKHDWSLPADEKAWMVSLLDAGNAVSAAQPPSEEQIVTALEAAESDGRDGQPRESSDGSGTGERTSTTPSHDSGEQHSHGGGSSQSDAPHGSQPTTRHGSFPVVVVAERDADDGETNPEWLERNQESDREAVRMALDYESSQGRSPKEMPHNNPGYDIRSTDAQGQLRYIEVKAHLGEWTPKDYVRLRKEQYQKALDEGDRYWLYVVDRVSEDEGARLYRIQNPARSATEYCFPGGWVALAQPVDGG